MRQETISSLTITYPDYMVWDGDNNVVMLQVSSGTALLRVTIGGTTAEYTSDTDTVVIDISRQLIKNNVYGAVTLTVYAASTSPVFSANRSYTCYLCQGRTLADRYHFSGRKIFLPYGSTAVEIATGASATITGGPAAVTSLVPTITSYTITGSCVVTVTYVSKQLQGDVNDPEYSLTTTYEVEVGDCYPERGIVIGWRDIDGCKRYLLGRVMGRVSKAETEDYRIPKLGTSQGTVRDSAVRYVTGVRRVLEVGFAQVDEAYHLEEILYSDEVWLVSPYDGSTVPVVPEFSEMDVEAKSKEEKVLKFRLQQ